MIYSNCPTWNRWVSPFKSYYRPYKWHHAQFFLGSASRIECQNAYQWIYGDQYIRWLYFAPVMKKRLLVCCFIAAQLLCKVVAQQKADSLEARFLHPPMEAKPYVWWHWMGSNYSKYGITKDLEAMKAAGIGGATIFNLTSAVQESGAPIGNLPWPGQTYRSPAYWEALRFAATEAKRLGLEIGMHNSVGYSTTGGPWIKEQQAMQKIVWQSVALEGGKTIQVQLPRPVLLTASGWSSSKKQASYYQDLAVLAVPDKDSIGLQEIVNLSAKMDTAGKLTWEAPEGKWLVYRYGISPTMKEPHPIPEELFGKALEVDKMTKSANEYHWNVVIDSLKKYLGKNIGGSFKHVLIDSYESGTQNWSPTFRQEFMAQKGYDPLPWLVTMGKTITDTKDPKQRRIINNGETTKRFEWDYNDVINRMFFDNGWSVAKAKCHAAGLRLQWEPYSGQFDTNEGTVLADLPMGEFWIGGKGGINANIPAAARAAGKTVVGAESFTGLPSISKYTEDPALLKQSAEGTFASGVNRLVLHHWVLQPFNDQYQPGMGMGWWGTHFSRHQTWLQPGKAFFQYLGRTQALLQYGEQAGDYLCIDKQEGFGDLMATHNFLKEKIQVANHQIILSSGRKYALLVVPKGDTMLPAVAQKLQHLVSEGAYIVSPKPLASPSLQDYPKADAAIKTIGTLVWGNEKEHNYGKGWVTTSLADGIKKTQLQPDFVVEQADSAKYIKYVHRIKGGTHLYYIANVGNGAQYVTASFRVNGLQPEIWQSENGSICDAPVWQAINGRTNVSLHVKAMQSLFVVFRKPVQPMNHAIALKVNGTANEWVLDYPNHFAYPITDKSSDIVAEYASGLRSESKENPLERNKFIEGNWQVQFQPKLGQGFQMEFPGLMDFSSHSNPDVKYFAGTAHYLKTIIINEALLKTGVHVLLDLGTVNDIVQLSVTQQDLGVLWYPPYQIDITKALHPGENNLDIAVTNNWANRLIGDEQEPEDFEIGTDRGARGRALKAYPDWFIQQQPRPSQGRKAFTNWFYYKKDSPLEPAGLVGPVRLVTTRVFDLAVPKLER